MFRYNKGSGTQYNLVNLQQNGCIVSPILSKLVLKITKDTT